MLTYTVCAIDVNMQWHTAMLSPIFSSSAVRDEVLGIAMPTIVCDIDWGAVY